MNCVHCGSPGSKHIKTSRISDEINKFGRREIVFQVESETIVSYGKDGLYHCAACTKSFTFQEGVAQKKMVANPQTKLG